MHIKSIELQGFKSYRGKTTLRFSPGACQRADAGRGGGLRLRAACRRPRRRFLRRRRRRRLRAWAGRARARPPTAALTRVRQASM